jgi:hypothetical protein
MISRRQQTALSPETPNATHSCLSKGNPRLHGAKTKGSGDQNQTLASEQKGYQ